MQRSSRDIWGDDDDAKVKRRPKIPNVNKLIPAVEAPLPGQSYNPTPQDYSRLIDVALEALPKDNLESDEPLTELVRRALPSLDVDHISFKKKQMLASLITRNKTDEESILSVLDELSEDGDGAASDKDDGGDEGDDDVAMDDEGARARKLKRKTRAQRNKQKLHRQEVKKAQLRKRVKKLVHDIERMKASDATPDVRGNRHRHATTEERVRAHLERVARGELDTKFGNKVFKADPPQVALSEELASCLRQLQTPSKSAVDNVVQSIYRRGLLPARPVIDQRYRDLVRKKASKRSMKFKSKLLKGI